MKRHGAHEGVKMPKRVPSEIPELPEYGLRTMLVDSVTTRILDFLILYRGSTYSMSEIARNSHVSWRAFNRVWPKIESLGLVASEGRQGAAKLYRFNEDHPLARALIRATVEFALAGAEREIHYIGNSVGPFISARPRRP